MLVIGLTGGIGSGKTTVANAFAALGAGVVDTDEIAHGLTGAGGAAMSAIRQSFGEQVCKADGSLDRDAMRALIFADAGERRRLEAILHPMIRDKAQQLIVDLAARHVYTLLVVPLLVESGQWKDQLTRILVVDCDVQTQEERVMARSGLPLATVRAIISTQASREQRLAVADDVIDNSANEDASTATKRLFERVSKLDACYRGLALA